MAARGILRSTLIAALVAAGSTTPLLAQRAAPAPSRSVVVWPFEDGGQVESAGARLTRAFEVTVRRARWQLIPYEQVREVVAGVERLPGGSAPAAGLLTPQALERIRRESGAEWVIVGSVTDSWCDSLWGARCAMECSYRLISTETGAVLDSGTLFDLSSGLSDAAINISVRAVTSMRRLGG
jgi:hypothetical protein